ncbi:MAG: serine protease, partial [Deltaproteobacteria bacterium]|nr:serine protease [Deltaproteobacteria bacterium]
MVSGKSAGCVLHGAARVLAVGLVLGLVACPKSGVQKPPQAAGEKKGESFSKAGAMGKGEHEVKSATLPQGMLGSEISLSGFYEDDTPQDEPEGVHGDDEGEKGMVERAGGVPGRGQNAVQDVYRRVAPATVIVRSQRGYGTGVIYDPAGWILTNHHVIAHAWRENFRWKVKVALGRLKKGGLMEKREKIYDAYVHKSDPLLDLAVIKLVDPPKDLVAIPISSTDPSPGEAVSALGHAGIGLVWAIKDGQISAVGKLSTHLAQLMLHSGKEKKGGDKGDAALSPKMRSRMKKMRKKLDEYRKQLETKKPALVIQSTCDISQGDSGGPLVNRQAEIVGLNAFVRSGGLAKKESNFHIHVREMRAFVKKVPEKAPQRLPDPWVDGGTVAKVGDADMDQKIDVMVLHKFVSYRVFFRSMRKLRPQAYLLDLDQDTAKGGTLPKPKELLAKRSFDAEFLFLTQDSHLYAWYDTDNDGKQDVLLVASKYNNKVLEGFRIDAAGKLQKDATLTKGPLVRPEMFKDSALGTRLAKAGQHFFSPALLPRAGNGGKPNFPHPISGVGHEGVLFDYDRDGKADTLRAKGLFARGFVFDVDQDTLGKHPARTPLAKLLELGHKIDAEMSLIAQQRARWAWYDTDNDGHFDLLLHNSGFPKSVVQQAWRVDKKGKSTPDKSQIGRLMAQPFLVAGQ